MYYMYIIYTSLQLLFSSSLEIVSKMQNEKNKTSWDHVHSLHTNFPT